MSSLSQAASSVEKRTNARYWIVVMLFIVTSFNYEFAGENTIYGSIRLTNRQTFQFHGILKKNVKPVHQMLHSVGLDALATANDMNRNVLCTSNPYESQLHAEAYEWAKKISEHLLPRTRAYAEIWLDQEKVATTDEEPILGQTYLPRKFKTTVSDVRRASSRK